MIFTFTYEILSSEGEQLCRETVTTDLDLTEGTGSLLDRARNWVDNYGVHVDTCIDDRIAILGIHSLHPRWLDLQIAELLGWTRCQVGGECSTGIPPSHYAKTWIPHFSTGAVGSWEFVQYLREHHTLNGDPGPGFLLTLTDGYMQQGQYECEIAIPNPGYGRAGEAPLAIALAALRALGKIPPEDPGSGEEQA